MKHEVDLVSVECHLPKRQIYQRFLRLNVKPFHYCKNFHYVQLLEKIWIEAISRLIMKGRFLIKSRGWFLTTIFSSRLGSFTPGYVVFHLSMKFHIQHVSYKHGSVIPRYITSYLGMKLPTWVRSFIPGNETSYLGMKLPTCDQCYDF
jgi:hypothetical protein